LAGLLISSCQKESKEQNPEIAVQSAKTKPKNECRLVASNVNDAFSFAYDTYHYNSLGLCDVWTDNSSFGNNVYNQRYDANGRLVGSEWNYEGSLITTIEFTYQNGRIVKESWYWAGTTDLYDEIWFTYNARGQIVKNESFVNDWYAETKYAPDGSVLSGEIIFGGSPYFSFYYTYNRPVKNPYLAVTGIDMFFPYYTPSAFSSKFRHAAEKEIIYDFDGSPLVMFDYDPAKTTWEVGGQNYALSNDCYDPLSNGWYNYSFEYENCGSDNGPSQSISTLNINNTNLKKGSLMNLLRRNPTMTVKEQFTKLREQMRSIKNLGIHN
jgi:hypothetical protein